MITQGEDETAEEKEEGIEGILSDVLDDENVIKATLTQVKPKAGQVKPKPGQGIFGSNITCPQILEQWSKAKTEKENEEVVKKIDLDKMDLVEKMSQITQVR